ncbi:MAG: hypothetical protein CVU92_04505 [Firmicutes bacterium HGW-Firmicutes-17]|nr:MAG: hypothetical protein CVU92_04505 [Firmicutes bacterium HGW-Firmicutes-17]
MLKDSLSNNQRPEDLERILSMLKEYNNYLNKNGLFEDNLDLIVPLLARLFCFTVAKRVVSSEQRLKEIKKIIRIFGTSGTIRSLLEDKDAIKSLRTISSKKEMLFYSFCLSLLKNQAYNFLVILFVGLSPMLNHYINTHLKI